MPEQSLGLKPGEVMMDNSALTKSSACGDWVKLQLSNHHCLEFVCLKGFVRNAEHGSGFFSLFVFVF